MRLPARALGPLAGCLGLLLAVAPPAAAQSGGGWQPGPQAAGDNTYMGNIDAPTSGATINSGATFLVSGWFVDSTAQGWAGADQAQVWLGTVQGGKLLGNALVAQNRPDVAAALGNPYWAASGFSAALSGSDIPPGPQVLTVYLHTGNKGWWSRSVNVNGTAATSSPSSSSSSSSSSSPTSTQQLTSGGAVVTVTSPTNNQCVSTHNSSFTITGTVSDQANVDNIDVWIDGERDAAGGFEIGTTTPNPDGTWSISFVPTHYASIFSNLYVYAHDKATGQTTEVIRGFTITDKSC